MTRQISMGLLGAILVVTGCDVGDIGGSPTALGGSDGGTAQCSDTFTREIHLLSDKTTNVGSVSISFDAGEVVIAITMGAGYVMASNDVQIGVALPLHHYPSTFDPAATWSETRVPISDLGAICTDLLKIRVDLTVRESGGETDMAAGMFTDREWWDNSVLVGWFEYFAICMPCERGHCRYTQGYWKTHPLAWPVDSLTLGGVVYTKQQLLVLLKTPPRGDGSMILAHQLIAAKLNVANGADDDPAIADGDAWLAANADADGRLPFGKDPATHEEATAIAEDLTFYNQSQHCD